MKSRVMIGVILFIVSIYISTFNVPAYACGTDSLETDPTILIKSTEIIVRATLSGYGDPPPPDSRIRFLEFRVDEVLKGENVPSAFLIKGILTEKDDYNDRSVPYDLVRPMGRGGSCWAYHYMRGAEYLLFLKRHDPGEADSLEWGDVTPYWASMAATNEQLHSADDAWLLWVKDYLKRGDGEENRTNLLLLRDTPNNGMQRTRKSAALSSLSFVRAADAGR